MPDARGQLPRPPVAEAARAAERLDVGRDEQRQTLGLRQDVGRLDVGDAGRGEQLGDLGDAERHGRDERCPTVLDELAERAAQGGGWPGIALPGCQESDGQVLEPADQEREEPRRGVVGPLQVLDDDDARRRPGERLPQHRADRSVEADLGAGRVQGRQGVPLLRRPEGLHEPGELGELVALEVGGETRPGDEGAAEQLGDDTERQAGLTFVAPRRDDRPPAVGEPQAQLLDDPSLARAGGTLEADHTAGRPDGAHGRQQDCHDVLLAEQRRQLGDRPRGATRGGRGVAPGGLGGRQGGRSGQRRWEPGGADLLVEGGRLREGSDAELAFEDPDAVAVLAQGGSSLAGPGVQPHQGLMCGLVQGVEGEPAAGARQRILEPAGGEVSRRHQPREHGPVTLAKVLGHKALPVVELRASPQREAGEKVVPVQHGSLSERAEAALFGQALELPQRRTRSKHDRARPSCGRRRGPAPTAELVTDKVRRSAERARESGASGQKSPASRSRLCSPSVAASSAKSAVALRVSKVAATPSRSTTAGPSSARRSVAGNVP